jgi:uncharacterized membrane protein
MKDTQLYTLELRLDAVQKELNSIKQDIALLKNHSIEVPVPSQEPVHPPWGKNLDLENYLGGNLLGYAGMLALVLASLWFIKFAFDNNWLNESGRIYIGLLLGFSIVSTSLYLAKKMYSVISEGVLGSGISVLYISIASAYYFYDLLSVEEAFVYLLVLCTISTLFSGLVKSQIIYSFSILGSIFTPIVLSSGENSYTFLFTYLLVVNVLYLFAARNNSWKLAPYLLLLGNSTVYSFWSSENLHQSSFLVPFIYLTLTFCIFLFREVYYVPKLSLKSNKWSILFILINSFFFLFSGSYLFHHFYPNLLAHFLLGVSYLLLFFYFVNQKLITSVGISEEPSVLTAQSSIWFLFVVSLFASLTDFGDEQLQTALWVGFAGLLSVGSAHTKRKGFMFLSIIFWVIALFKLYVIESNYNEGYLILYNSRFAIFLLASLLAYSTYRIQKRKLGFSGRGFLVFAVANLVVGSLVENRYAIDDVYYRNLGYSYILAGFAIFSLVPGFVYKDKPLRVMGIALSVIVVAKFYLYDIMNMSLAVKIIAGFTFGVALILLSVFYKKYKSRTSKD